MSDFLILYANIMISNIHVPSPTGTPGSPGLLPPSISIGELLPDKSVVNDRELLARNELLEMDWKWIGNGLELIVRNICKLNP